MSTRPLSPAAQRHWRMRPLALSLACIGAAAPVWGQINPSAIAGFPQVGNVVAGTARVSLDSVISGVWPFLLSLTALMFLFVLFPQLILVPASWLR